MVVTDVGRSNAHVNAPRNTGRDCKLANSADLSSDLMKEKSSFGIEMKQKADGCSTKKAEKIAVGVDELRLSSPDKTQKNKKASQSRTPGLRKSQISKSGSISSSGSSQSSSPSSRSSSVSSSASSQSGSVLSSSSSRSSSMSSTSSSQSGSLSSSSSSRLGSISSSGSSRSSSLSSSGSSRLGSVKKHRSSTKYTTLVSRTKYISREKYRRSRRANSRSRSRSWSRSCYRRSRHQMSCRSPIRSRSRSSLRYRRSRSGSRSRCSSGLQRTCHNVISKTQSSHTRSRSRSRGRSIHLTQKDKKTLLEIAKANADKLFGKDIIRLPPNLRLTNPFKDENFDFEKYNSEVAKEVTRREKHTNEVEEDEPLQKLQNAPSRMETNHWIAFSVKNAVAKPLYHKSSSGAIKGSPENKRKGGPYGQWVLVQSGRKNGDKTQAR
ncbi:arginine/serine-rich protein 1 [Amblyraja radiata]|uniref:arginine/serine-rich protein 1 n=1 Tax=Amblyraja radiata TaxID=386614 RepID=UPI001402D03A|nr:arginine/serine-rich protein 1 [Amblyraja radiata]